MSEPDQPVIVGEIMGLFGVKGWIKVRSYTEPREQIGQYQPWQVGTNGEWRLFDVTTVQQQGKGLIAKLTGIDDRDQAAELVHAEIAIERRQLPALAENEFYWRDLQGLTVVNLNGIELGTIRYLLETGVHDVLVVQKDGGPEMLIPCVLNATVHSIDTGSGLVRVDWEADY